MLQVIIPMAGLGSRFSKYGFKTNKYLLPINLQLQPMIELAILTLNVPNTSKFYFIINEENGIDENLRKLLGEICIKNGFSYNILSVDKLTEGPASTVSLVKPLIDMDLPILVSNSDQVLYKWNCDNFLQVCSKYDGCVLTYKPDYPLKIGSIDKNSFIHIDSQTGLVDECREKIVLSNTALVGVHYFKTARIFFDAYDYMVSKNIRAPNGEFYLSLCYQAMIELGKTVGYCDLQHHEKFLPVGEPADYFKYLDDYGGYNLYKQSLSDQRTLFANGVSYIKYVKTNFIKNMQNPGLIVLLSGIAETSTGIALEKYDITNMDIEFKENCEIIIIQSMDYIVNNHTTTGNIFKPKDFTRGWIIGDFKPSIFRTEQFELGILNHPKYQQWDNHYHKYADEINILLDGSMVLNNTPIHKGELFFIKKRQIACPKFLEDCKILCIKTPSIIGDKYCL